MGKPTLSVICIVVSAIFVAFGWYKIRINQLEQHKKIMLIAGIFALLFFIMYCSRTIFLGNTTFGGPEKYKVYYTIFLIFHITLATLGGVFGIVSIVTGLKNRLKLHKKIGPITSTIWFFSATTGFVVYLFLYILYPSGETTSLIKAILGF